MLIPLIKVIDKGFNGREHIVGTRSHDELYVDDDGQITYYNLQNSGGTGPDGCYEFVVEDLGPYKRIPLVSEIDGHVLVEKQRLEALEHIARLAKRVRKLDGGSGTVELGAARLALWAALDELEGEHG